MRVATGTVTGDGKMVELDGKRLPKGGRVKVVYLGKGGWVLDEAHTQELLEAVAQGRRGEVFSVEEVFAALPPRK